MLQCSYTELPNSDAEGDSEIASTNMESDGSRNSNIDEEIVFIGVVLLLIVVLVCLTAIVIAFIRRNRQRKLDKLLLQRQPRYADE